jgi:hypothetical protein
VFLSDTLTVGSDLQREIAGALSGCRVAAVLASKTYGQATNGLFDTANEMHYILGEGKPFVLVRMIPPDACWAAPGFEFDASEVGSVWLPGERIPAGLADALRDLVLQEEAEAQAGALLLDPARIIQRRYRGHMARRMIRRMHFSAARMQSAFRGFSARVPRDIFISYRFEEARREALALRKALGKARLRVFVPDLNPRDSQPHAIAINLAGCRLAVILASCHYGLRSIEVPSRPSPLGAAA